MLSEIERAIEEMHDNIFGCECADCQKHNEPYRTAISALQDQIMPVEPCVWCKEMEYTIIDDDFGQPVHPNMIHFCWSCGRELKGGE